MAVLRALGRSLIVAMVLAGPTILPALAYASPPDPSWLAGIYDDADYDDVVVLVMSATGTIALAVFAGVQELPPLNEGAPQITEDASAPLLRSPTRPRGPPLHASPFRPQ